MHFDLLGHRPRNLCYAKHGKLYTPSSLTYAAGVFRFLVGASVAFFALAFAAIFFGDG
jgi:hypothetical protein